MPVWHLKPFLEIFFTFGNGNKSWCGVRQKTLMGANTQRTVQRGFYFGSYHNWIALYPLMSMLSRYIDEESSWIKINSLTLMPKCSLLITNNMYNVKSNIFTSVISTFFACGYLGCSIVTTVACWSSESKNLIQGHWHWSYLLLLFSFLFLSDFLWPHGLQHARLPCPSPSPRACSNSYPLNQWCHPTISSSVTPFSSCPLSFPAIGSFLINQLFALKLLVNYVPSRNLHETIND